MGERAILIEFEPEISENTLGKVLFYKNKIENHYFEVKVEVINTYNSLLVYYDYTIENIYDEVLALKSLLQGTKITKNTTVQLYNIPVCYDAEFGLDLKLISRKKNLSLDQIIQLHTQPIYTVYFIGFLPGFLYLGGLDKKLQISRKIQPRMLVQKGAVGIGENQTGIYPKSSPGGWQIIGNSPVPLFDKNRLPPCEISAGDRVKFYQVSKSEFVKISKEIKEGKFQFKKADYEGGN
jgi:KipI family sensor histidine kinase inhibitor